MKIRCKFDLSGVDVSKKSKESSLLRVTIKLNFYYHFTLLFRHKQDSLYVANTRIRCAEI